MSAERAPGWYWVYIVSGWQCAEYHGGFWSVTFSVEAWHDDDFHKIGTRIEEPKD